MKMEIFFRISHLEKAPSRVKVSAVPIYKKKQDDFNILFAKDSLSRFFLLGLLNRHYINIISREAVWSQHSFLEFLYRVVFFLMQKRVQMKENRYKATEGVGQIQKLVFEWNETYKNVLKEGYNLHLMEFTPFK